MKSDQKRSSSKLARSKAIAASSSRAQIEVSGAIERPDSAADDEGGHRIRAASQIQMHEIQSASADDLARLKALAGHGAVLDVWSTPREWLVHGHQIDAIESVELRSAARSRLTALELATLDSSPVTEAAAAFSRRPTSVRIVDDAVLQAARYLVLLRLGASVKASTVAHVASGPVFRMIAIIVRLRLDLLHRGLLAADDHRHFSLISLGELYGLPRTFAVGCKAELRRMNRLFGQQLWSDAPLLDAPPKQTVDPADPPLEAGPERKPEPHLPLPDDFVGLMGKRSLWVIHELGPVLLEVGARLLHDWTMAALGGSCSKFTRKRITVKVLEESFREPKSRDEGGAVFRCTPPFPIQLSTHGEEAGNRFRSRAGLSPEAEESNIGRSITGVDDAMLQEPPDLDEPLSWPPRNWAHFIGLCGVLQGAHFFIASMALAARQSETMALSRRCVEYGKDGNWYAMGRTFKLVQQFEGEKRDWELPEVVALAMEQQGRLVSLLEKMPWTTDLSALLDPDFTGFEGDHLWCRLGTGTTDARQMPRDPNKLLRRYARDLGMEIAPGGQPLRTHRFRKTIARLAALAIDEAPIILKKLFGHRDIEMTLHYILADKALAAEIEQVVKELHMMRAKAPVEAFIAQVSAGQDVADGAGVTEVDFAGYGGRGVARIAETIARYGDQRAARSGMRNSKEMFGAEEVDDLVRILTGDGTYFDVVKPGIVCTKRIGEWGPCSRKKGQADRSNCQESCDHRLEDPWQRADADGCVEEALDAYERATADGEVLLISFWGEQVRRNVIRFDDLRDKWMKNTTVGEIMRSGVVAQTL